ncbi:cytidylate kinase family protein [Patescibacteria group bacterium]|nr:cytidylate kinase family protein [Patescibacteria group bacterium]
MLITIGGLPGSGSSTVGSLLSEKIDRRRIDAGNLWDKMARDYNTDVLGLNKLAENDDSIDHDLDKRMVATAKEQPDIILEGRLIGYFCQKEAIPAFKIWITADQTIRINRLKQDGRETERVKEREASERKRYLSLYNIDIDDHSVYDLVVNANKQTPDKIVGLILDKLSDLKIISK